MSKAYPLPHGLQPISLNLRQAAAFIGVSHQVMLRMIRDGSIPPPRSYGKRSLYVIDELRAAVLGLPKADGNLPSLPDGEA